jgi:hypothetical protein
MTTPTRRVRYRLALRNTFFIPPVDTAHDSNPIGNGPEMQNIFVRAIEEEIGVGPVAKMQAALGDLVGREVKPSPKAVSGVAAVVDSLVRRGASLSELKNVIQELEQLHNFLDAEGQRLEQEISEYVQLKKSTVSSTRLIADNLLHWKES